MDDLLRNLDFGVDFEMDTDLDCLSSSDDLLDLNEDDLLNIDLLTNSECEDLEDAQELTDELIDIDSYFVNEDSQLNEKELKNINCIFNNLTTSKDLSLNNSLNCPLNSSINGCLNSSINASINNSINSSILTTSLNSPVNKVSVNSLFLINGLNLTSQSSQFNSLNSSCLNSSLNLSNSNLISNFKRSQNQSFSKKESDPLSPDDSYCLSEDDSSILDNDETSQLTIEDHDQELPIAINYFNLNKNSDKKLNQNKFNLILTKDYQSKMCKIVDNKIIKRKLSNSKGVSLLAKPKKIKKDLNQLTNDNYRKFLNYFYQDHDYCSLH